jgi:hypothetical protein
MVRWLLEIAPAELVRQRFGTEAEEYAEKQLDEVSRRKPTWSADYECPYCGQRWILDYPGAPPHGLAAVARLRTIGEAARDVRMALADVALIFPDNVSAQESAATLDEYLKAYADPPKR